MSTALTRESFIVDFESQDDGHAIDLIGNALPGLFEGHAVLEMSNLSTGTGQQGGARVLDLDGTDDNLTMGIQDVFVPPATGFSMTMWFRPESLWIRWISQLRSAGF